MRDKNFAFVQAFDDAVQRRRSNFGIVTRQDQDDRFKSRQRFLAIDEGSIHQSVQCADQPVLEEIAHRQSVSVPVSVSVGAIGLPHLAF